MHIILGMGELKDKQSSETRETELLREIIVKPLLDDRGYKGIVQEIPKCPSCNLKLDSRGYGQKFEFVKKIINGRRFDLIVPECPRCGRKVEPGWRVVN